MAEAAEAVDAPPQGADRKAVAEETVSSEAMVVPDAAAEDEAMVVRPLA